MRKRTLPEPEFVTAEINDNLTVYGWKFDKYGISIFADSVEEGEHEFIRAFEFEYNKAF